MRVYDETMVAPGDEEVTGFVLQLNFYNCSFLYIGVTLIVIIIIIIIITRPD